MTGEHRKTISIASVCLLAVMLMAGCTVTYKFSGASIDYTKTHSISIADFPNQAALINPTLASDLTEGIRDIFTKQTRLQILRKGGDLELEGEITDYQLTPLAIAADSYSAETKLTMTVRVRFTNNTNPEESFEKNYSAFQTFDSSRMLNDVQDELCGIMIQEIAENIYNDTVAKW